MTLACAHFARDVRKKVVVTTSEEQPILAVDVHGAEAVTGGPTLRCGRADDAWARRCSHQPAARRRLLQLHVSSCGALIADEHQEPLTIFVVRLLDEFVRDSGPRPKCCTRMVRTWR